MTDLTARIRRRAACAAGLGAALLIALAAASAWARSVEVLPYPFEQIWPTAIRFLRLDRGAVLREKDPDSGYVLFDLPENGRMWKGSLELVRTTDSDGRDATRVLFTLPDLPRHFEATLIDKLGAKAKEDNGSPAPPRPRKPPEAPKPVADGGATHPPSGDLPRFDSR